MRRDLIRRDKTRFDLASFKLDSNSPMPEPEQTQQYEQGRLARREGEPDTACPYPSSRGVNSQRVWWFIGWLDEKNKHLLGLPDVDEGANQPAETDQAG